MKLFIVLFAFVLVACSNASYLDWLQWINPDMDKANMPNWNQLSVKFTWPTIMGIYNNKPMTVEEAIKDGWTLLSDGCTTTKKKESVHFKGARYVKKDEINTVLIFDVNGLIVGVQMAIPTTTVKVATKWIGKSILKMGDKYYITVYFTEPSNVCKVQNNRRKNMVGDKLMIVNGLNDIIMEIPLKEEGLKNTKWVKGRCFIGMGVHYFYDVSKDMDCDNFFPVFLMYNRNVLDGFGFATQGDLKGKNMEHPSNYMLSMFMGGKNLPTCLKDSPMVTTQHVFLNDNYRLC